MPLCDAFTPHLVVVVVASESENFSFLELECESFARDCAALASRRKPWAWLGTRSTVRVWLSKDSRSWVAIWGFWILLISCANFWMNQLLTMKIIYLRIIEAAEKIVFLVGNLCKLLKAQTAYRCRHLDLEKYFPGKHWKLWTRCKSSIPDGHKTML